MATTFYGSGTTPVRGDTRLMLLTKVLGALQAQAGAFASNNPSRNDTRRMVRVKIDCARKGIAKTGM